MHKSYESAFLGLYRGIFTDISVNLPTIAGIARDYDRVVRTVATRGLRSLTVDFPAYGKHFDACLDAGRLTPSNIPNFGWKSGTGHRFLSGLFSRVFTRDGVLRVDYCPDSVFYIRQVLYAVKKPKFDCPEEATYAAFEKYKAIESQLPLPSLNWGGDGFDGGSLGHLHYDDFGGITPAEQGSIDPSAQQGLFDTVQFVADCVSTSLGYFKPEEWRPKHGPGAVADRLLVDGWKYQFPSWSARLESEFPSADIGIANYNAWFDTHVAGSFEDIEVPSYVLPVPKTQKGPRLIAKESVSTMWCQQIIWSYLESSIRSTPIKASIHFRSQQKNADAALKSSKSGTHWTVDLSDASDRVSLRLVERLFRRNYPLMRALWASRSRHTLLPTKAGGSELLELRKFAPQGSASTFPLQTIIFTIHAVASVIFSRGWPLSTYSIRRAAKEVLVFGDDSVVPEDSGRLYVALLTYSGLSVNLAKTYTRGKFRESCGTEAFDGWDVTPAYLTQPIVKPTPESIVATLECSNNFFKKGLWHASEAILSTIPRHILKETPVVAMGSGAHGVESYLGSRPTPYVRWNDKLHRNEFRMFVPTGSDPRTHVGGPGHLLQYYTEAPSNDNHWSSGAGSRSRLKLKRRWVAYHEDIKVSHR